MTATINGLVTQEPHVMSDVKRWSRRHPELGTEPISTERFISPEFFDRERAQIFSKSWINVGSLHDLAGPGSFFTRDLAVLEKAILITQDADGAVRAFHNVCSHRGMKLVWEESGPCPRALVCRFHGWAYGKDGALQSVPDEGEFPFHLLQLQYRYDVPERANWKVAIDAQNEIYHVPMLAPVHRFLAQGAFASNEDGYTRLNTFSREGLHTRYTSVSEDYEETALSKKLTAGNPPWNEQILPLEDPFEFHVLFPNMVMSFFGNMMFTYNFWPVDVNHLVWEIRLHFTEPKTLADLVSRDFSAKRFRDLLCEDKTGHEALQTGCESKARPYLVIGDQEVQIRAFHRSVDDYMAGVQNG